MHLSELTLNIRFVNRFGLENLHEVKRLPVFDFVNGQDFLRR
jgi:hypothetical protein